jgi:hypothetical protein
MNGFQSAQVQDVQIVQIERQFMMSHFLCKTSYNGAHTRGGMLTISQAESSQSFPTIPQHNIQIPEYTHYFEIKRLAEKEIKNMLKIANQKVPNSLSAKKETLLYRVQCCGQSSSVIIVEQKGEKHTMYRDQSHSKQEAIAFDAYKSIEQQVIALCRQWYLQKSIQNDSKNQSNNQMSTSYGVQSKKKPNQYDGLPRLEQLTQKVIASNNNWSDYRKNPSQAVSLVKSEFLKHIDDATFIRIINDILHEDTLRRYQKK